MERKTENFSLEWDTAHRALTHQSKWPWSDLVRLVHTYADIEKKDYSVLEIGCGYGANIPFFLSIDTQYFGIEGSQFAVDQLKQRFPVLKEKIKRADFTKEIPFRRKFDLIIDRASLSHNNTSAIKNSIQLLKEKLHNSGLFIGIDWFSTAHSEFANNGNLVDDELTKNQFSDGPFQDIGRVHFSDENHLKELFSGFNFLTLEHKKLKTMIPNTNLTIATWNFVLEKLDSMPCGT